MGNFFSGENLVLMNSVGHRVWKEFPHHGALTDVNIWSRVLDQQEQHDWMWCRSELAGDLISWENSQLNITGGLNLTSVEREETCLKASAQEKKNYLTFNSIKNFDETVDFCQKIGGQIAVAWDEEIFTAMNKSFSGVCEEKDGFYLGFTDREVEGEWVDVNTGAPMTWQPWRTGQPNNYGGNENCAVDFRREGKFNDIICSTTYCSICEVMTGGETYELTGACEESNVDRFYVLKSSELLSGMTGRNLVFSQADRRWEIVDRDGQLMAFVVKAQLPLGLHPWHFLDTICTDQGKSVRSLNLHLNVERPGHFCCNDGTCIDSDLVCNNFDNCGDRSDELGNCSMLSLKPGYNKNLPPIEFEKEKKILLSINATLTCLRMFEINDGESFFDLRFMLHLQWFDKGLNFLFLKNKEIENSLSERMVEDIWVPKIKFEDAKNYIENNNPLYYVSRKVEGHLETDEVTEIYFGNENPVNLLLNSRILFTCSFDNIKNFPFGRQKCNLKFHLFGNDNDLTNVLPHFVSYGPTDVGQYVIEYWTVESHFDNVTRTKNVHVTMVLKRKETKHTEENSSFILIYFQEAWQHPFGDLPSNCPDEHDQPGH